MNRDPWEPPPAIGPAPGRDYEGVLANYDQMWAIVDHSALDYRDVGALLRLFRFIGFPVPGYVHEVPVSRATLGKVWSCKVDAVTDILKGLRLAGLIKVRYRYSCSLCMHGEDFYFRQCPHCGDKAKCWCQMYVAPLALTANACVLPGQRPPVQHAEPSLRHDDPACRHKAPASHFPPYRLCPHCGSVEPASHFSVCPQRSGFLRLVPGDPRAQDRPLPLTPAEQAEQGRADRDQAALLFQHLREGRQGACSRPDPAPAKLTVVNSDPPKQVTPNTGPPADPPAPPARPGDHAPSNQNDCSGGTGGLSPRSRAPRADQSAPGHAVRMEACADCGANTPYWLPLRAGQKPYCPTCWHAYGPSGPAMPTGP